MRIASRAFKNLLVELSDRSAFREIRNRLVPSGTVGGRIARQDSTILEFSRQIYNAVCLADLN